MTKNIRNFAGVLRAPAFLTKGIRSIGIRVINNTGSSIAANKLVAVSGYSTTAKLPKIVLADADVAGHGDVYVTSAAIANGAKGDVWKGLLSAASLDTNSASTVGDPVYLSTTAGAFTHTAPTAVNARTQLVGYVQVKSASVGQILWDIQQPSKFSTNETNGIGFSTGQGGAVTQLTNRSTGVTLSTLSGAITTDATSLAAGAEAEFTVTNTLVEATDVVVVCLKTESTTGTSLPFVSTVAAGSFKITLTNLHATTADTSVSVINFVVIKAVAA